MSEQDFTNQGQNFAGNKRVEEPNSYLRGAIGALLGALAGALPWGIVYFLGWFVGLLGFLIGLLAANGYNLLKGKLGRLAPYIIIAAIVIGVVAGEALGDCITFAQLISNGDIESATYADIPIILVHALIDDTEFFLSTLKDVGLGLVFGIVGAWKIIKAVIDASRTC